MSEAQTARAPEANEGLPTVRRRKAAFALGIGLMLSVLDASMSNVALPSIAKDLNQSAAAVVWIVNAYGLTVAMTLMPMAAIGERVGFKLLFRCGLVLFILASIASALSPSLSVLLVCRVVQGLGGSAIMCLFGALVRHIYPAHLIGRGIGWNSMTVAVSSVMGPSLGAFILSTASWHWIFVFNIPVGCLALFGAKYLPDVAPIQSRFDWFSALLSMSAIGLLILGIDYLATYTWQASLLIVAAVAVVTFLIRRSSAQPAPLFPVDLFRIPAMRFALAASASTFSAQMATFVSLPFYLLTTLQRSQITVGILLAGWPVGAAMIAAIAGPLSDRFPVAILSGIGAAAMALGLAAIALMPADVDNTWLFAAMMLAGVGFGFFQTPNNRVLLSAAPRHRAGAVGGLQATTRVFSQTFGGAVVAMVFSMGFTSGPLLGLWVAVCFALCAVTVNAIRYRQAPHAGQHG